MRVRAAALVGWVLLGLIPCVGVVAPSATAVADDAPPKSAPTTPDQAADVILQLRKAGDTEAVAALMQRDDPDPWLVIEALLARGEQRVAIDVLPYPSRPQTLGAITYAVRRRLRDDDSARWTLLLEQGRSLADGRMEEAPRPSVVRKWPETVTEIALLYARGRAALAVEDPADKTLAEAHDMLWEAGRSASSVGWVRRAGSAFHLAGVALYKAGDRAGAINAWRRRLPVEARIERWQNVVVTTNNMMALAIQLKDAMALVDAYDAGMRALPASRGAERAAIQGRVGTSLTIVGQAEMGYRHLLAALSTARSLGRPDLLVDQLLAVGSYHQERMAYADAKLFFDEAWAIAETLTGPHRKARIQQQLGYLHLGLKADKQALEYLAHALRLYREAGDKLETARAHMNLGAAQMELEMHAEALENLRAANDGLEALGDLINLGRSLPMTASALEALGRPEEGVPLLEHALQLQSQIDDLPGRLNLRLTLADQLRRAGRHDEARTHLERAGADAQQHGGWAMRVLVLSAQARNEFDAQQYREVLNIVELAEPFLAQASQGHADEDAATVSTRFAELMGLGVLSARRLNRTDEVLRQLETLRAADLRAAIQIGDKDAPHIPAELLALETAAREEEALAQADLAAARKTGKRKTIRARRQLYERAWASLESVVERIRTIERAANAIPDPVALKTLQATLPSGAVMALFNATSPSAPCIALVVRPDRVTSVELAPLETIRAACRDVRVAHKRAPMAAALDRIRHLVVAPLQLDKADRLILVSPVDALSFVPLALLFPDRDAAFVPSASAFVRSRGIEITAEHVLALGDPDYGFEAHASSQADFEQRGGQLSRLPHTRAEVKAIADVSLVGRAASEQALRTFLEQGPWIAIHFACHGVIDHEDPMRSALAVSASATDDGFITVQDVYRLPIRTRLVTLSACETGHGETLQGVGMLGLTQAFMMAGARSVLCSLWRVDDAATRTLMIHFYELWRPTDGSKGIPAPTALRLAQAHVRAQPKWRHPYYWAAWVLWNVP